MQNYQQDNYKKQQLDTARKVQQNLDKLTQLEQIEKLLLEKLGKTQITQKEAIFNL
jgi:hypothetical protein